jgi:hypothetical protein
MKMRLITTTAIGLAMATTAFAQSPSKQPVDKNPPAAQTQPSNPPGSSAVQQNAPQQNAPQQNAQPQGNQAANPAPSGTNQSAGSTNQPSSGTTSQAPASGTSPSQAQTAPSQQPSSQQSANPPPANTNQAQQPNTDSNTAQQQPAASGNTAQQPGSTTAQQPNTTQQPSTAQSSQTNVNAQVNINDQQRTRISQSVAKLDVKPITNVNFSLSVGTVVPRDVHLATLPADVVEIVPQYRGFSFFVVRDEIVIVEPQSYKIVATLPYSGSTAAAVPQRERTKTTFSDRDREVIRKHNRSEVRQNRRTEGRTTGSATRSEIRVGDQLPDAVEIETFPDAVYRDAPTLREYRYINRENRTYIIEPRERRVIEEID